MASTKGTAVQPSSNGLAVKQQITDALRELSQNSDDVQADIMAAILSAESEEELMAVLEKSTVGVRDRLGIPYRVTSVKLNESSVRDSTLPAYCVIEATDLRTNKVELLTCGAGSVLAGMVKLHQLNLLPFDVVFFEGPETSNGYHVVSFRRANDQDRDRF